MFGNGVPLSARLALIVAVVAIAAVALQASLDADEAAPSACSSANMQTAAVDAAAARRIYDGELHGRELRTDAGHVRNFPALLDALVHGNAAAVRAAVHTIVYTPHWHIVRLRVISHGRVIADVGGPSIIAPVSGALRSRGHTVGRYVMSVQDDVGFLKLVTRFIGVPIDLYRGGSFLMGTLTPAPSLPSTGRSVSVGGRKYFIDVMTMRAFPAGDLKVALLIPADTATRASCAAVQVAAWGSIARHLAARFKPLPSHYQDLVDVLRSTTGGLAYVRSGPRRIAGGATPARLPGSGTLTYRGRRWSVYSWESVPPARIYVLVPPA
jgi:hypothetical protein